MIKDVDKVSSSFCLIGSKKNFISFTQQVMVLMRMHQREVRKRKLGEEALVRGHGEVEDFGA